MTETTPAPARNQDGTVSCVYCRVTGPAAHFQLTGPPEVQQNWVCRQANLCTLRTVLPLSPGQNTGELVHAVLTLVRELVQVARTDTAERNSGGTLGSLAQTRHAQAYRRMLGTQDLARLHVVLDAAADWLNVHDGDSAERLRQARAEYGCRTCGAIGRDDCVTVTGITEVPRTHGTWGPRWHAGRTL